MADKQIQIQENENSLYIIKDGVPTKVTPKQHGHDTIIWKNGQVLDIDRSERIRVIGQEVI